MSNEMPLLAEAMEMAREAGRALPEGLEWGMRSVWPDLRSRGGFRYPFPGNWATCEDGIDETNRGPCPAREGDGICWATTWAGMAQGGIPARAVLLVGWRREDVLGENKEKKRGRRLFVAELIDGARLVREHGNGANLSEAHLSRADLSRADLSGAVLSRANLSGADLYGANLPGADLSRTNLYGAGLSGANLCRADLFRAYLYGADLSGADLSEANLYGANLSGADLSGAGLSGANLSGAVVDRRTAWPAEFDPGARTATGGD